MNKSELKLIKVVFLFFLSLNFDGIKEISFFVTVSKVGVWVEGRGFFLILFETRG